MADKIILGSSSAGHCVPRALPLVLAVAAGLAYMPTAYAQLEEIVVTARKRAESIQSVPAAVFAVGQETIRNYGITDLTAVGRLLPGLMINRTDVNSGANIYLRGIGSPNISIAFDQAVGINIDNVPISKGRAIIQSFFDMQQVEVLKGPQALFFGKNSTAGVVSVTTANPGDSFEGYGRGGYEMNGGRYYAEGVLSAPVSEAFGARLAVRGSWMQKGFLTNDSERYTGFPRETKLPQEDEYGARLTLTYSLSDFFDVVGKLSYDQLENSGPSSYSQLVNCQGPGGTPQPHFGRPNLGDCKRDLLQSYPAFDPVLARGFPGSNGGQPYLDYSGLLGSVTANVNWDTVTLTSVTGLYSYTTEAFDNYDGGSASTVFGHEDADYRSFTQEFRLLTKFDSPVNFSIGAFFDDTSLEFRRNVLLIGHGADPATGRTDSFDTGGETDGETLSAFGEVIWTISEAVELSGGARYSKEKKDSVLGSFFNNQNAPFAFVQTPIKDEFDDSNVSISSTVRWTPTENWTVFASYKEGYKSGGTNLSEIPFATVTAQTVGFDSEQAEGFELGLKTHLLNGDLWLGLTLYQYTLEDLQVSTFNPQTVSRELANAGELRATGIELDAEYQPANIENLRFRGSIYYNQARFQEFIGACYTGQTIAAGCNQVLTGSRFNAQDYRDRPSAFAPDWVGSLGGMYDFAIGSGGLMFGINADIRYSDEYYLQGTLAPTQIQESYIDLSAAVRVYEGNSNKWEVALIGRNLTDELIGGSANDQTGTGAGTGTASGVLADTNLILGRPREVAVQLTYRF